MPRPAHFEIHAADPSRAAKWYTELFGWRCTHLPQIDYWMVDTSHGDEPGINGGIMKRMGPEPGKGAPVNGFVCTVNVETIDQYLGKAVELGAQVGVAKFSVPGVGYVAYFVDPDHNIVGLHQEDPNAR